MNNNKIIFLFNQGDIGANLAEKLKDDFTIFNANSDVEALKLLNSKSPHIIVLNVKTFEYGSVIIDMIKSNEKFNDVPILVICEDLEKLNDWYNLGALDCVLPTIDSQIFISKINAIITVLFKYLSLKEETEILKLSSLVDFETGLFNKKYLANRVIGEISRSIRQGESISFVIVDIDDFNVLTDTFGSDAKDFVLKEIINMVKQVVRLSDVVIRYGESQIGILCPITDRTGLETLVEKLRMLIARNVFQYEESRIKTTVSIGAYALGTSDFNSLEKKVNNIFSYTEDALKRAKKNENKVEFFD